MVLSCPKEGMTFGWLSQEWSLRRAVPGKGPLLGAQKVGFGEGSFKGDAAGGLRVGSGMGL